LLYERPDGMINAVDPKWTRTERSAIGGDDGEIACHR
jgi:hypothetical protein